MIRFQRIGRTNDPAFRIVVLEKERAAQAGNIVEQVGTYNPRSKALTMNEEQIKYWISKGAQPTDSIRNLLISKKVIEGKKVNALPKKTVQVDEEAVAAAAKAEADAAAAKAAEKKAAEEAETAAAAPVPEEVVATAEESTPVAEDVAMPTEAEVAAEAEAATVETPVLHDAASASVEESASEVPAEAPAADEAPLINVSSDEASSDQPKADVAAA